LKYEGIKKVGKCLDVNTESNLMPKNYIKVTFLFFLGLFHFYLWKEAKTFTIFDHIEK
jgi:hypothetical protein